MTDVVSLQQAADHGPIFVSLGFLGMDEIWQGEEADSASQLSAAGPEFVKGGHSAHVAHDVDAQAIDSGGVATKVDGESVLQGLEGEGRDGNDFGLKFS